MKTFTDGRKATEFSRKQINVIFAKAKAHQLKVESWFMTEMYHLAEYYGYDDNRSVEREETSILSILDFIFAGDLEAAQKLIDKETATSLDLSSNKIAKKYDRAFIA